MALNFEGLEKIDAVCNEIAHKKSLQYGMAGLLEYGEQGMMIRITDKFNRLKYLMNNRLNNVTFDGESDFEKQCQTIEDQILDMLNYLKYLKLLLRGKLTD